MRHLLTAVAVLPLLVACGEQATPTQQRKTNPAVTVALPSPTEARELIAQSQPFGDYQFTYASWTFRTDTPLSHPTQLSMARDLETAGWLRLNENHVELTDKSRGDKRFLLRPNGSLDIVPLARKEIIAVTSVEPTAGGATASVQWRWIPNEVGSAISSGLVKERFDATHTAEVTLQPSDGGWEVWGVTEAAP